MRALLLATCCLLCGSACRQSNVDSISPDNGNRSPRSAEQPTEGPRSEPVETAIVLRDATARTGITFQHTDGSSGRRYLIETMSAGLVLFDYDGDGLVDIYFLNGAPLRGAEISPPPRNALYRNLGNWEFDDVTEWAGVGDMGFGLGATAADFDNDGDEDLFVNNAGPNVLYRNNGDGTFTQVSRLAGTDGGNRVGAGVCFLDIEGDGDLDLYVANYVQFSYEAHRARSFGGVPAYPGPLDQPPEADQLLRNNGDGTFEDISQVSGVAKQAATGMGITCCDYDNDGDTDVLVANDVMANGLLQNDGQGRFHDVAIETGLAFDAEGLPQSSMGVDCGDYDNDGWLDAYITSYQDELATLYRNLGNGFLHDATHLSGAGQGTATHVTWGNGFVDFDCDGDRDLFVACGHTEDNIERRETNAIYKARNVVLENSGSATFSDVSAHCGDGLDAVMASRGAGFDDLNNDGRVDVVVLNSRCPPTVISNESQGGQHWIEIDLVGTRANRTGVGSHVIVAAGVLVQRDEVHSGRGYQSHFGARLHFGLGGRQRIERIEVRWLGGGVDIVENVGVDQRVTIIQDHGYVSQKADARPL